MPAPLIHLSYASASTSLPQQLAKDLNDILQEARLHNHQHHINGVLYYGKGKFFQYLEGPADILESLYQKLLRDPRHHRLEILDRGALDQYQFVGWAMKYVTMNPDLQDWLREQGISGFDPHALQGARAEAFTLRLRQMHGMQPDQAAPAAQPDSARGLPSRQLALIGTALAALAVILTFILWAPYG